MSKPRRIKKEDIGSPSNFVHVQHVGFGQKGPCGPTMASVSVGESERRPTLSSENTSSQLGYDDQVSEQSFKVERRNKGIRQSQIPRHHRSTTTCIFPSENQYRSIETRESIDSPVPSSRNRSSLKPTFGSLLNLSFLPLGMGKSSSKSPSIGKAKRMSLLNLTASNLFAPTPKPSNEENRETVHMTSYTRRRSLSKEVNDHVPSTLTKQNDDVFSSAIVNNPPPKPPRSNSNASSTRIPLAKLGRSKSSMAEFSKRPKLRLKIPPPPVAPPPVPPEVQRKNDVESEGLPSPPPSPLPSPPPSPLSPAMVADDVPLRNPKSVPRPRIIPLPSTSSVDSADPSSPQYLTPAGGCSPQPNNVESPFPVLSPTIPPSSTPFYSPSRNAPGTPPVWPLQPSWPSTISMQRKEASIPEVPSPCQEEMETSENEYTPVMSIVDSFLSGEHKGFEEQVESKTTETSPAEENEDQATSDMVNNIAVTSSNLNVITSVLRETVTLAQWPSFAQKLFEGIHKDSSGCNSLTDREKDMYTSLLSKTLEMWSEMAGENAVVEKLFTILDEENLHQTTESLREILRNMRMSETKSE